MSRYRKEFWNDDITDPILTIATGGMNLVTKIAVDTLLPGPDSTKWYCKITDTKSGASATGSGYSKGEASADAWFKLTGKKDEKYKQNEAERQRKKAEWEKRQKERERKQKEWEEKKKERERKQKEWEARQKERERKKKEWEERQKERERKKKEWEARQAEREKKKREWEARQAERERKKREWEARQKERERKQQEWEARKAEQQRERERKQREWEARQAERERKKREWEARKEENERRKREWEERKRNRGSGGKRKGSSGGCYITTAVCGSLNKGDDCTELQTIRSFRDDWLALQPEGIEIILKYYETAPVIVQEIDKLVNSSEVYSLIWENHLQSFFQSIKLGSHEFALKLYMNMVDELINEYMKKE